MKQSGFNLIDLTTALLIISSAAAVVAGSLLDMTSEYQFQKSAETFLRTASIARQAALSTGLPVSLTVDDSKQRYAAALRGTRPANWRRLSGETSFCKVPSRVVTFFARGNAAPAGSFELCSGSSRIQVVISPSGRPRWERLK